jgi:glycosyltransferase involved in cell wall biosynthesis
VRVLLTLASSYLTGPAERMLGDAVALRDAGHRVTIGIDTRRAGNLLEACQKRGLTVAEELKLSRVSGLWESWRDIRALRRRLTAEVDLVHTHFSHDHHLALFAARGLRRRVRIVRSLESATTGSTFALRRTDGIEVPFQALAESERLRSLGKTIRVLAGAVDPARFAPGRSPRLRSALGVPFDAPLIGIVSRIKPDRRHSDLVDAFARIAQEVPQARLAIIGRGEGTAALERQVGRLGLRGRVLFAGYWGGEDLVDAYRGLDVAVWLAPGNDGGARGVLEAMAVGLPVVAYSTPPMDEQLTDRSGVLVAPGDIEGLARKLVELAQGHGLRAVIGNRARERVLARYTWAQRGPALLSFYEGLPGVPPAGRSSRQA